MILLYDCQIRDDSDDASFSFFRRAKKGKSDKLLVGRLRHLPIKQVSVDLEIFKNFDDLFTFILSITDKKREDFIPQEKNKNDSFFYEEDEEGEEEEEEELYTSLEAIFLKDEAVSSNLENLIISHIEEPQSLHILMKNEDVLGIAFLDNKFACVSTSRVLKPIKSYPMDFL